MSHNFFVGFNWISVGIMATFFSYLFGYKEERKKNPYLRLSWIPKVKNSNPSNIP